MEAWKGATTWAAARNAWVRPFVGFGFADLEEKLRSEGKAADASDTKFAVWPGVLVGYPIGDFVLGGDFRYTFVFDAENANSAAFFLNLGALM